MYSMMQPRELGQHSAAQAVQHISMAKQQQQQQQQRHEAVTGNAAPFMQAHAGD